MQRNRCAAQRTLEKNKVNIETKQKFLASFNRFFDIFGVIRTFVDSI